LLKLAIDVSGDMCLFVTTI